jgi:hypothetical protein
METFALSSGKSYWYIGSLSEWPLCSEQRRCTAAVCGKCLFVDVIEANPHGTVAAVHELPVQLNINSKMLTMRGAIGFFGGKAANSVGHYVACCRRKGNNWQVYDDRKNHSGTCSASTHVRIHLLLYTE